jgi:hypothetical protein
MTFGNLFYYLMLYCFTYIWRQNLSCQPKSQKYDLQSPVVPLLSNPGEDIVPFPNFATLSCIVYLVDKLKELSEQDTIWNRQNLENNMEHIEFKTSGFTCFYFKLLIGFGCMIFVKVIFHFGCLLGCGNKQETRMHTHATKTKKHLG